MAFQARLFLTLVLFPMTCFGQITTDQARTMPLPELAEKLLGESGKIMIDVDRPRFPNVLEAVTFYSHATVPGSQFGICSADWVTVDFNEHGFVDTLRSERRYGIAGNIHPPSSEWTYDEFGEMCASVASTRSYFPAPGPQEALEIALYVEAISGRGPFSKQNFSFACDGICTQGRNVLASLKMEDIDEAKTIDCEPTNLKIPSCFELVIGDGRVGPFPKKFRIYGTNYMNKVIITAVKVYVGSTLA